MSSLLWPSHYISRWAYGVLLYEMLVGQPPFDGKVDFLRKKMDQDVLFFIWMPDHTSKIEWNETNYDNLYHTRWRRGGIVCSHHRPHGKHWIFIFFIEFAYLGYLLPFHWIFNSIQYVSHRFPDFFDILQVNKVSTRFFLFRFPTPSPLVKRQRTSVKGSVLVLSMWSLVSVSILSLLSLLVIKTQFGVKKKQSCKYIRNEQKK